jgi:hypothetical protein
MGTRARVEVFEGEDCIVSIYRQFDGYPSGLGQELHDFLKPRKIINGIGMDQTAENSANGAGCLAAQLVAHLKDKIGNVYLEPRMKVDGECGEEYVYRLHVNDKDISVVLSGGGVTAFGVANDPKTFADLFRGGVEEFGQWLSKQGQE